uniref:Myeloid leukemia factor 2 n=1 Tax=Otolemur garnettii TaxID=30611 RepID=H0XLG6_OTOGA
TGKFILILAPPCPLLTPIQCPFLHRNILSRKIQPPSGPVSSITDPNVPGIRPASRGVQAGAVSPFGMLGMGMDTFGMMNNMIGSTEHMTAGGNCQTFSSSTVISYCNASDGAPVRQETSERHSAPGGIQEIRRTIWDSDSGLEQMSIGHHIRDRVHILQRSRNHRPGDQEERQDYINLGESEAAAFDHDWWRETSRLGQQRPLEFRRHGRRAEGPLGLAIQGPEDAPSRWSHHHDW